MTSYNVIIAQRLLTNFTVMKVMLSAVIVGMIGLAVLKHFGHVKPHPAPGTLGSNVIGGLIFGLGFGLLGYCPGTVAGAVGTGALDALLGGVVGILIGIAVFVEIYPKIKVRILRRGPFLCRHGPGVLKTEHLADDRRYGSGDDRVPGAS